MKNIDSYRRRFYTLIESKMGDVRPLIVEDNGDDEENVGGDPDQLINSMKDPEATKKVAENIQNMAQKLKEEITKDSKTVGNLVNDDTQLNNIAACFSVTELVPEDFKTNPESYEFQGQSLGGTNPFINSKELEDPEKIEYYNVDGEKVLVNQQGIVDDINEANQELFSSSNDADSLIQYYLDFKNEKIEGTSKQRLVLAAIQTRGSVLLPRKVNDRLTSPKIVVITKGVQTPTIAAEKGSTTKTEGGITTSTTQGQTIPIDLGGGSVGADQLAGGEKDNLFTFEVLKDNISDATKLINYVYSTVQSLKAQKSKELNQRIEDIKAYIDSIQITCSASNIYGGKAVTPTHNNDGTPTGKEYNSSITYQYYVSPDAKTPKTTTTDANQAQGNYDLATRRGNAIHNVFVTNITKMGFNDTTIPQPTLNIRITDTGAKDDKVRFIEKYSRPGQYALIRLNVRLTGIEEIPGKSKSVVSFTQCSVWLSPLSEVKGVKRKFNWDLSKGIYTNMGPLRKLLGVPAKRRNKVRTGANFRGFKLGLGKLIPSLFGQGKKGGV